MLRRYEIESAQDHTDQQDVIAALASGDLLAGDLLGIVDKQPRHIETHCSHVFLTADRAFKLKKAIAFSYLDYRSVAARERFIRAELELNRRTAPQLYLNRHKIARRPGGGLMLAPPEDPAPAIDWLLEMRRFPDDALLADHAEQQGLAPDLIRDLADAIHDFHLSAEQRPDHGSAEETEHVLLECLDNLRLRVPPLDRRSVVNLAAELTTQFGLHASLIDQRRIAGFVRHCHGDLHLGNICLIDGKPVLFDCIDFSEMLSCIDVAYDLAFLLMDLCHRGHRDQASLLVNRWIDRTGDTASLTLLPFFQSLRAAIRAHILATSHRDSEATAYLDSAARHLQPAAPRLIAIGGLSGSGKSTLARGIAPDYRPLPGARIIRSDSLRKRLAGVAPETRLPVESYTQRMSDRVYAMMLTEARQVLAAGYTAIIDAAFLRAGERQAIDALAAELRVPCYGLWLDVPAAILADRLAQRRNDASDADRTVLDKQLSLDLGPMTWQRVAAAGDAASNLTTLRQALAPASAQR